MGPILGIGIGALGLPAGAILAIIPLWLLTTYGVARTVFHRTSTRREQAFLQLTDRLAALTEELVGRQE
jgi:hypothetical protein